MTQLAPEAIGAQTSPVVRQREHQVTKVVVVVEVTMVEAVVVEVSPPRDNVYAVTLQVRISFSNRGGGENYLKKS